MFNVRSHFIHEYKCRSYPTGTSKIKKSQNTFPLIRMHQGRILYDCDIFLSLIII